MAKNKATIPITVYKDFFNPLITRINQLKQKAMDMKKNIDENKEKELKDDLTNLYNDIIEIHKKDTLFPKRDNRDFIDDVEEEFKKVLNDWIDIVIALLIEYVNFYSETRDWAIEYTMSGKKISSFYPEFF